MNERMSSIGAVSSFFLLCICFQLYSNFNAISNHINNRREISVEDDFKILEAPVKSEEGPKVALLMTFPGAGTTYTTYLVKKASNTVTATNYGNEYLNQNNESVALYSDVSGPYLWQDENMQGMNVPSTYILTKTHCGGRCQDCPPREYIENVDSFMHQCLRAPRVVSRQYLADNVRDGFKDGEVKEIEISPGILTPFLMHSYDPKLVQKMVHVVKSPFSNIVSRFHHEYKSLVHKFDTSENFEYTYDRNGFQAWCQLEDNKYLEEEKQAYGDSIFELTKNVPCHAEFYRYVQWHNLAIDTASKLNIQSLAFNYEDFGLNINERVSELLEYLHLPLVDQDFMPYHASDVGDHFTDEQMDAVAIFIRALANEHTWALVCGYLPYHNLAHAYRFRASPSQETFCPGSKFRSHTDVGFDTKSQVVDSINQQQNE